MSGHVMRSGHRVSIHHVETMPPMEDIAWALAHTTRFQGSLDTEGYDVATHSLALACLVDRPTRLRALLHDAAEGILGDIIRPVKHMADMLWFRKLEWRWQEHIYEMHGLEPYHREGEQRNMDSPELRRLDLALCFFEAELLGTPEMYASLIELASEREPHMPYLTARQKTACAPIIEARAGREGWEVANEWLRYVYMETGVAA